MVSRVHAYAILMLATLCCGRKADLKRCSFGKTRKLYTTNCCDLDLHGVPQDLKDSTQVLDLSDNKIKFIYNTSFTHYTSLQILYLSDNHILHIHEGAFAPLTELQVLDLSSNSLRHVPYDLPSTLIKLYLAANPIERVNYSNANALKYLSLAETHLKTLPALGLMPSLSHLNLSESEIRPSLTPEYLAPLCKLHTLYLPKNLLVEESQKCDCHRLDAWIKTHQITTDHLSCPFGIENSPECNTTSFPQAEERYSACLGEWDRMNTPYLAIFLGSAVFLAALLVGFLIWWTRRRRASRPGKTSEKTNKAPDSKEPSLLTS